MGSCQLRSLRKVASALFTITLSRATKNCRYEDTSEFDEPFESPDETTEEPLHVNVAPRETARSESVVASQPSVVAEAEPLEGFTRMQLVLVVIDTLRQAGAPKKATELVSLLRKELRFRGLVRKDVNSVLYGELLKRGLANVDSSNRWRLLSQ